MRTLVSDIRWTLHKAAFELKVIFYYLPQYLYFRVFVYK